MLIKRISQDRKKPVFEVMSWPAEELLWQQAFYSIDDNGDKPIIKPRKVTLQESKDAFRSMFK